MSGPAAASKPRRVLLVSPHFPPDTSAGAHRIRLLAPHLPAFGWEPTVLTVRPEGYEGRLDPELAALVPPALRVERCRALPPRWSRRLGVGDLGLRALPGLALAAGGLLARQEFAAVLITLYPTYPALLAPWLRRRFGVPVVLDYQDPWVGSWGETVGGGPGGAVDRKSRLTRRLAAFLEPLAVGAAAGLTAVSAATYEAVLARNPEAAGLPCAAIPLGGEPADFARLAAAPRPNGFFDPSDGRFHLCYVGTLLPLGLETLAALLAAVARVGSRRPELYARLALHFFGTSNQTAAGAPQRVLPLARRLGVADRVSEAAPRVDYLDALRILTQASAILLLGSSERHYTPSKLYPALLARRPLLAAYDERSSAVPLLRRAGAQLVTFGDGRPAGDQAEALAGALIALMDAAAGAGEGAGEGVCAGVDADGGEERNAASDRRCGDAGGEADTVAGGGAAGARGPDALDGWSARQLAGRLAAFLDQVAPRSSPPP